MIYITHIDNDTVDKINSTLHSLVIEEETGDRATRGGFQSVNIRHGFDYRILTRFLPFDFAYRTDWIHYIEYDVGGFQKRHKHEKHEKFSWVLYLNDSDGDTVFYNEKLNDNYKELTVQSRNKPVKNQAVLFDGLQYHSSSVPEKNTTRIALNINFQ